MGSNFFCFRLKPEKSYLKPFSRLATLLYVGLISLLVSTREAAVPGKPDSGSNFLVFGLPVIVTTSVFVFLLYWKGEKM